MRFGHVASLVFLAYGPAVAAALWIRVRPRIAADPSLRVGYRRLIVGFGAWLTLPWLVLAAGCILGGLPDPSALRRPAEFGLWACAFWVAAFGAFGYAAWWVAWGGGAAALARHPGALPLPAWSSGQLKALIVGLVALASLGNAAMLIWPL